MNQLWINSSENWKTAESLEFLRRTFKKIKTKNKKKLLLNVWVCTFDVHPCEGTCACGCQRMKLESSIIPPYSLGKHLSSNPRASIDGVLCGQFAPCFILWIVAGGQLVSGIFMSTSLACNKHFNHWALSVTLRITHFDRTHIRVAFKNHLSQIKTEIFIKLGAGILICRVL